MRNLLREYRRRRGAVQCLQDAGTCLVIGNHEGALKCIFIWEQRQDRIADGEETWRDQRAPAGMARQRQVPPPPPPPPFGRPDTTAHGL